MSLTNIYLNRSNYFGIACFRYCVTLFDIPNSLFRGCFNVWKRDIRTEHGVPKYSQRVNIGKHYSQQEGERRKSYSAAVIDGIKRNSRIYVGDSIVRKTDTRLSKGEDVVVCLPGARIEHVTE